MSARVLISLAISLALTIILEVLVFLFLTRRKRKDLLLLILANVITNPIVVLSFWLISLYTSWNVNIPLVPLEAFAVLAEGYIYKKYGDGFRRPYLFAFAANMFSFWLGVLIEHLI